jgi:hypothetical protein
MRHFTVGQERAVATLVNKNYDLLDRLDGRPADRLRLAIHRAHARYHEAGAPNDRGFYHGLIVGYAVATKVFQRKMSGR